MRVRHYQVFAELLRRSGLGKQPFSGVEIGVWKGRMSAHLLDDFLFLTLYMVDSWTTHFKEECLGNQERNFSRALSATSKFGTRAVICREDSLAAAARFAAEGRQFDFVFIDADHTYEGVKADLAAWYPLVRKSGVFAGHDYDYIAPLAQHFGVKMAVDEWAASRGLTVKKSRQFVWHVVA